MMNIRKEKLNVITSAGPGVQERYMVGYDMYFGNGVKHPVTAYVNTNLGTVNGYDKETTEFLIEAFGMKAENAASLRSKIRYHNQRIGWVLGLRDARPLVNDIFAKDVGLIHPPLLSNIKFGKYTVTRDLLCFGSFGVDVEIFKVNNPTFYTQQILTACYQIGCQMTT